MARSRFPYGCRCWGVEEYRPTLQDSRVLASAAIVGPASRAGRESQCRFGPEVVLIDLHDTAADDDLARAIGSLRGVRSLNLANTQITDQAMVHIASLQHLENLSLQGTRITDASAHHLGRPSKLTSLNIADTKMTGSALKSLQKLGSLQTLYLSDYQLTADGIDNLREIGSRPLLQVRVAKGSGKATFDLLKERNVGKWAGFAEFQDEPLWTFRIPWNRCTGHVFELVSSKGTLSSDQAATLRRSLTSGSVLWRRRRGGGTSTWSNIMPPPPGTEAITDSREYVRAVILGDMVRIRVTDRSETALAALPELLALSEVSDEQLLARAKEVFSAASPEGRYDWQLKQIEESPKATALTLRDRLLYVLVHLQWDHPRVQALQTQMIEQDDPEMRMAAIASWAWGRGGWGYTGWQLDDRAPA